MAALDQNEERTFDDEMVSERHWQHGIAGVDPFKNVDEARGEIAETQKREES